MSADIVERLRRAYQKDFLAFRLEDLSEAADEIERLRKQRDDAWTLRAELMTKIEEAIDGA